MGSTAETPDISELLLSKICSTGGGGGGGDTSKMHQLYTFVVLLYYFDDGLWFACAFVRRVMSSINSSWKHFPQGHLDFPLIPGNLTWRLMTFDGYRFVTYKELKALVNVDTSPYDAEGNRMTRNACT